MLRYLLRNNKLIFAYLPLAPLRALCSMALSASMAAAIDYASGGQLDDIWKYLIAFGLYIIIDFAVDQSCITVRFGIIKKTMKNLRADVYRHIMRMEYTAFSKKNSADYIASLTSDMDLLRGSYFAILLDLYIDILTFSFASIYMFAISPVLGVFVYATSILQAVVPILFAPMMEKLGASFSRSQETYMRTLKEHFSAFMTARIFHMEDPLDQKYSEALEETEENKRTLSTRKVLASNVSFIFSTVTYLGIYLLGAVLVIKGHISTGAIIAAAQLSTYISNPIYALNSSLTELKSTTAPIKKLNKLLAQPYDNGGEKVLVNGKGDISIRDLSFAYGEKQILHSISCDFEHGKKYLIVGGSGSGKSTLLNLMAGLRSDYSGSIFLDGIDRKELSHRNLTRNLCYLSQEPFLFDDTLYNNICLFSKVSERRIADVLEQVELQHLVGTLPDGIHTQIGEGASCLSGGEKQRVSIARALLTGSKILLLDESTCHLDSETARSIERLVMGIKDVTVVLVSHNATPVAQELADVVFEMQNGMLTQIRRCDASVQKGAAAK